MARLWHVSGTDLLAGAYSSQTVTRHPSRFKLLAEALPGCKHVGEWHSHHLLGVNGPMTPPAHSVAAAFPGAWFATNPGKDATPADRHRLGKQGLACRLHLSRDRRGLRLRLPDATLLLGANFPASPPPVLSGPRPRGQPWSPSTKSGGLVLGGLAVALSAPAHRAAPPSQRPIGSAESPHDRSGPAPSAL